METPKNVTIDSDIELLADDFSFESPFLDAFTNETEAFAFSLGYGGANIQTVEGLADSWAINLTPRSFNLTVKGRDKAKLLLDTQFQKTYFLYSPSVTPETKFGVPIPYHVGTIQASAVAREACLLAGLGLVWDAPDYPVVNPIETTNGFNGNIAEALKKLIEPLQITEMFRVDLFLVGSDVYVKKRVWPYVADYTIPLTDLKTANISPAKENTNPDGPIRSIYVIRDEVNESGAAWDRQETVTTEVYDKTGKIVILREVVTTYYTLEVTTKQIKTVYCMPPDGIVPDAVVFENLYLFEETTTLYDYGNAGVITSGYNRLENKTETSNHYAWQIRQGMSDLLYKCSVSIKEYAYAYSAADEMTQEVELKSTQNYNPDTTPKGTPDKDEKSISYHKINKDLLQVSMTHVKNGEVVDRRTITQAGQLPGPKKVGENGNAGILTRYTTTWHQEIPVNATGRDVEIENNLLSRAQLLQFGNELALEKSKRKYEFTFSGPPLPWLRKGMKFTITGELEDGTGNTFDLSPLVFLITHLTYQMTERSFTGSIKAVAWL